MELRPEDSHPEGGETGERIESGGERNHVHPSCRPGTMPVPIVPTDPPGPAVPVRGHGTACNTTPNRQKSIHTLEASLHFGNWTLVAHAKS